MATLTSGVVAQRVTSGEAPPPYSANHQQLTTQEEAPPPYSANHQQLTTQEEAPPPYNANFQQPTTHGEAPPPYTLYTPIVGWQTSRIRIITTAVAVPRLTAAALIGRENPNPYAFGRPPSHRSQSSETTSITGTTEDAVPIPSRPFWTNRKVVAIVLSALIAGGLCVIPGGPVILLTAAIFGKVVTGALVGGFVHGALIGSATSTIGGVTVPATGFAITAAASTVIGTLIEFVPVYCAISAISRWAASGRFSDLGLDAADAVEAASMFAQIVIIACHGVAALLESAA